MNRNETGLRYRTPAEVRAIPNEQWEEWLRGGTLPFSAFSAARDCQTTLRDHSQGDPAAHGGDHVTVKSRLQRSLEHDIHVESTYTRERGYDLFVSILRPIKVKLEAGTRWRIWRFNHEHGHGRRRFNAGPVSVAIFDREQP